MAFGLTGTDIESVPALAKRCHSRNPERPAMDGRAGLSEMRKVSPRTARMNTQGSECFLLAQHQTPFVPSAREAGVSRDQTVGWPVAAGLASPSGRAGVGRAPRTPPDFPLSPWGRGLGVRGAFYSHSTALRSSRVPAERVYRGTRQ